MNLFTQFINHKINSLNLNYLLINSREIFYDLLNNSLELMLDYLKENILQLIYCDFYDDILTHSYDILYQTFIENNFINNLLNISQQQSIDILFKINKLARLIIYKFVIPKRSYKKTYIRKDKNNKSFNLTVNFDKIEKTIKYLKNIPQPEQRTDEWYKFRNSTLTASNIWKIFASDYSQTQLILEKCETLNLDKFKVTNTNSPLHWGQKYEPVSILYYESIYSTKVDEFGCIPHSKYSFIAASPDGIVCDQSSNLFGRMLEIKNVVSREITGIPKMEYWIQMQLQMEVCDLNECDFLETKFVEYLSQEEYLLDNETKYKGIILQFLNGDLPHYIYAPFGLTDISSCEYQEWESSKFQENKNLEFITTLYWKLEKISCILVLRNKLWFNSIVNNIENFWKVLIEEKESGKYLERKKNKRKYQQLDNKQMSDFPNSGCLIKLN